MKSCVALMSLALLLASGCDDGGGGGGTGGGSGGGGTGGGAGELDRPHSTGGASWTVLVYMTADNDLEPFALDDLTEMMQVGSSSGFNLVVQVDRADGYAEGAIGGLPNFTTTKRVRVQQGFLEELADLGEANMADPATLTDFVSWGLRTYPADRTAVIFWDHGGGWAGFGVDEASGGALLKLPQIEAGLASGLAAGGSKPLTLVGFDACLMATYEVALTLAPHAEYLLASQEAEPGHGWDWTSLQALAQQPGTDPVTLGKGIIQGFGAQATQAQTVDTVTLSLVDLYRMGTLKRAVAGLIAAYGNGSGPLATAFARGNEAAQKFGDSPDVARAFHLVDLVGFGAAAAQASQTQALTAAQNELASAVGQVVVDKLAGSGRARATGLSVYFPPESRYYNADYDALSAAGDWRGLLSKYFQSSGSGLAVPTFTNANKLGDIGFDGNGSLALVGALAAGSADAIARATLLFGLVNGSTFLVLGDQPAVYDQSHATGAWNLSALSLSQGSNTAYGYTSLEQVDATRYALSIAFQYQRSSGAAAQNCIRQLVFSADSAGNVTLGSDTYYVESSGTYGELQPLPGSTLMPLLKSLDSNGTESVVAGGSTPFTATTVGGVTGFDLKLEYLKLNSGAAVFEIITVANAGGDGDAVVGTGTLP